MESTENYLCFQCRTSMDSICFLQLHEEALPAHKGLVPLGDTIVCDELVKAIEGVTTNGKTKLQQG